MNPKELATQLEEAFDEASDYSMHILRQEGCTYRMESYPILNKGINIEFCFRGETNYRFLVPWEYAQDHDKIRDYYKRFRAYVEPGETISDVSRLAEIFIENEFKLLNNAPN